MAKILSILECTGKEGEKYWDIALEGKDKKAYARKAGLKVGDEIDESRISLSKNGNSYNIRSEGQGYQDRKSAYVKNDDLIIAQVAYKGILELVNGGKLEPHDITETMIIRHGVWIKKAADMIRIMTDPDYAPPAAGPSAPPVAAQTPAPADKTATASPAPQIDMAEVLACDWSTFEKKDFDQALAGMARAKKLSPESAKAFLVDQFGIESSSMIPIAKRNEVLRIMSGLS